MDKNYRELGVVVWHFNQWAGPNRAWSKNPITTLDDWRAQKTFAEGYMENLALEALGVPAVAMPSTEAVAALMTGVIEASIMDLAYADHMGFSDVSNYITEVPLIPTWTAPVVMNAEMYDSLPPDLQEILMQVGREVELMVALAVQAEMVHSEFIVQLKGIEILKLEPEEYAEAVELLAPIQGE